MSALVSDAADLHLSFSGKAAALVSTFGLQQLGPAAPQARSNV